MSWGSLIFRYHEKNIYYILPLTIIVILAIKALGFPKVRQGLSNIFGMHYGDIKD